MSRKEEKKQTSKQVFTTAPLFMLRDESSLQIFIAAGKDDVERQGIIICDIAVLDADQFSW